MARQSQIRRMPTMLKGELGIGMFVDNPAEVHEEHKCEAVNVIHVH